MSNTPSPDLFKNFEVPAFETGTEVPVPPAGAVEVETSSSNNAFPYMPVIATVALVLILVIVAIIKKPLKKSEIEFIDDEPQKPVKKEKKPQQQKVETTIEIEKPKAVEIKTAKQERKNFATPTNLNKCIRLFLENTRTR